MAFDPEDLIRKLPELIHKLDTMRAHLSDEASEVAEEWECLGNAGGQRADHAAELLGRLRPHLAAIEQFAGRCQKQITAMIADPFDRGALVQSEYS